jgi:hypothetical protein
VRGLVIAIVVVLVGVFTAVTVSVVRARHPLDRAVGTSFDSAAANAAGLEAIVAPRGCQKDSVNQYHCSAEVEATGQVRFATFRYQLWLTDDGCWRASSLIPVGALTRLAQLRGCIPK